MSHTKGKLKVVDGGWIESEKGRPVADVRVAYSPPVKEEDIANAHHLVACWNALEEIPTESLEKDKGGLEWVTNVALRNRELRQERDELVKALREATTLGAAYYDLGNANKDHPVFTEAKAILAKYPEQS